MTKKILIVDDEPDFTTMVKTRLESSGYSVISAADGKEGMEKIEAEKPDAVLLDILMPGIDGLKVLEKIRRKNKQLPIFMISAYSDEKRFKLAKKLNASGFIIKTGDLQKEVENITSILEVADKYKGQPGR